MATPVVVTMAKKKKNPASEEPPPARVVAWHCLRKDGAIGLDYVFGEEKKGLDFERIKPWMEVPGIANVRTPIAWSKMMKNGSVGFSYKKPPVVAKDDSSEYEEEEMDLSKDEENKVCPKKMGIDLDLLKLLMMDMKMGKKASAATETEGEEEVVAPKAPSSPIPTNLDQEGKGVSAPRPMSYANVVKNLGTGPPPRNHATKKSFMNSGLGRRLSFSPPTMDHVEIKVVEALPMESVWGWALLGQYVGFQPGHLKIMEMIRSWGVKANYRVEGGWMIFSFQSEFDCDKVLLGGPYFIQGKPMMLKNIPDKFSFNRRDVASTPLWVRIIGLSKTYWTPEVLSRIASHVGKPLFMDPVTDSRKRGSYARVLVEVNFAAPVKRKVRLHFDDGEVLECSFLLENEPSYCRECCSFGHNIDGCPFKVKKAPVGAKANTSSSAAMGGVVPAGIARDGTGMWPPAAPTNVTILAPPPSAPKEKVSGSPKKLNHQPDRSIGKGDIVSPSDMAHNVDEETAVEESNSKCLEHMEEEVNDDACDSDGQCKDSEEDTTASIKIKYKSMEKMFSSGASDVVVAL